LERWSVKTLFRLVLSLEHSNALTFFYSKKVTVKIGIVSDTHGNIENLEKAVEWMIKKHKISALYHLGDDYDDITRVPDLFLEVSRIPGLYDDRYKNGSLPAKNFEMVLGVSILLVHSLEKDATKEDIQRSDIVLYGHSHKAELKIVDGRLLMNPGHLKGPLDKNMPPSFGMITIADRNVSAAIFDLNFKQLRAMELVRSESGLYKT
jgi:putative phosphoesterase